jgi:hypothetical protein
VFRCLKQLHAEHRMPSAHLRSLAGTIRTNSMDQSKASEDVQTSATALADASSWPEPDSIAVRNGTISTLNRGVVQPSRFLFVSHSKIPKQEWCQYYDIIRNILSMWRL